MNSAVKEAMLDLNVHVSLIAEQVEGTTAAPFVKTGAVLTTDDASAADDGGEH